jgi:hypothetical protein
MILTTIASLTGRSLGVANVYHIVYTKPYQSWSRAFSTGGGRVAAMRPANFLGSNRLVFVFFGDVLGLIILIYESHV